MSLKNVLIIVNNIDESINFYEKLESGKYVVSYVRIGKMIMLFLG